VTIGVLPGSVQAMRLRPTRDAQPVRSSQRGSRMLFIAVCALLFVASATITILWDASMAAMDGMPMPGDWTMSMTWMRMPGQSWLDAAAAFLGMWGVMMLAMMLPSVAPTLWRLRAALVASGASRPGWLTALAGAGYFLVWTALGLVVYPLGVVLATAEMQQPSLARVVPVAAGVIVLLVGVLQFTARKARQLACCRGDMAHVARMPADALSALRHGASLALQCASCCGGLMVILLVTGVMDLGAMAAVTVAITLERAAPAGQRVAKVVGVAIVGIGALLVARALVFC
jgi:predicted metal-binding membrane protein